MLTTCLQVLVSYIIQNLLSVLAWLRIMPIHGIAWAKGDHRLAGSWKFRLWHTPQVAAVKAAFTDFQEASLFFVLGIHIALLYKYAGHLSTGGEGTYASALLDKSIDSIAVLITLQTMAFNQLGLLASDMDSIYTDAVSIAVAIVGMYTFTNIYNVDRKISIDEYRFLSRIPELRVAECGYNTSPMVYCAGGASLDFFLSNEYDNDVIGWTAFNLTFLPAIGIFFTIVVVMVVFSRMLFRIGNTRWWRARRRRGRREAQVQDLPVITKIGGDSTNAMDLVRATIVAMGLPTPRPKHAKVLAGVFSKLAVSPTVSEFVFLSALCALPVYHVYSMSVLFWTIQRYVFTDNSWSLGQIIALTVWAPVIFKLVYSRTGKQGSYSVRWVSHEYC